MSVQFQGVLLSTKSEHILYIYVSAVRLQIGDTDCLNSKQSSNSTGVLPRVHGSFSCGSGAVRVTRTAEGSGPISVLTCRLWIIGDTTGAYRLHYILAYVD